MKDILNGDRQVKDEMQQTQKTNIWRKKFVVKACKGGKEKIIRFGDANMTIKKNIPARRKSFRARHRCATAKDKFSARYWSCKNGKTKEIKCQNIME